MSVYESTVPQFDKQLNNLQKWLDKAEEHAKSKSFDVNTLMTARLAPDQLPLIRQIQIACDWAKNASSRLLGKQPPVHADTETTLEQIRERIKTCRAYLATLKREDFEGAEARIIPLPFLPVPGKAATGLDYLIESALPNFYFHTVTAYAILRHNGVSLGKADYIGGLRLRDV